MSFNGILRDNGAGKFDGALTSLATVITVADVATIVSAALTPVSAIILDADLASVTSAALTPTVSRTITLADTASITSAALTPTVGRTVHLGDTASITSAVNGTTLNISLIPDAASLVSTALEVTLHVSILVNEAPAVLEALDPTLGRVLDVEDVAPVSTESFDGDAHESFPQTLEGELASIAATAFDASTVQTTTAALASITSAALIPTIAVGYPQTINVNQVASITTLVHYHKIVNRASSDILAQVRVVQRQYSDMYALIGAIAAPKLGASLTPIPPANLRASLVINQPRDITAYIREGFNNTSDLNSTLVQVGHKESLPAFIRTQATTSKNMGAFIEVKSPLNLRAYVVGWVTDDIGGSLVTQRSRDLSAILQPTILAAIKNMPAYIRRVDSGTLDMGVTAFKAVVHTHTSDKVPNLRLVSRTFHNNKFLFGTHSKGLVAFTVEPIFGIFPDLHATIFAQQYYRSHIDASIRGYLFDTKDLPTTARAVSPQIKINKVVLSPNPLKELSASLTQRGGYKPMTAMLRPSRAGVTGTAPDAAFTTIASSYKFLLGTGRGLFIPQQNIPTIITTLFNNRHSTPDLRATAHGWMIADFGASIKDYPDHNLPATLLPLGIDRFRNLSATLEPMYTKDISASISSYGAYSGLPASTTPVGYINSISASINSFINPLSYNTISVSTKPFKDIGALINYGSLVSCASKSQFAAMSASIRAFEGGPDDNFVSLGASLTSRRVVLGMPADITGRKRTRIRTLTLSFRANTRSNSFVMGIIVPVAFSQLDMTASIAGLSHETDIGASVNPVRYALENILFTPSELAVNLRNPSSTKEIFLSFRDKVSSYVFEDITSAVYATEHGTWAIDLRSVNRQQNFFDRDPNSRERVIDDVLEFHSVDEAIRNAISIICDRVLDDMGASLTATGTIVGLGASMGVVSSDMFKDLQTKLVSVSHQPDIAATINTGPGSSGYATLPTLINSGGVGIYNSLGASVQGKPSQEIGAEITVI